MQMFERIWHNAVLKMKSSYLVLCPEGQQNSL